VRRSGLSSFESAAPNQKHSDKPKRRPPPRSLPSGSPYTCLVKVCSYNAPRLVVAKRTNLLFLFLFFRTPEARRAERLPKVLAARL